MSSDRGSLLRELCGGAGLVALALVAALAGCEKQPEKVLDVEAPGVDIEVMESPDDGSRSVDIESPPDSAGDPVPEH